MIHSSAIIDKKASIDSSVKIGPYACIGPNVEIGAGSEIGSHVVIDGPCQIGEGCRIFPFASVGTEPQDKKYFGEKSWLYVGKNNTIREYVNINRGTEAGGGKTVLGEGNWIMATCHIAHDCILGNNIIMANGTTLGGHVTILDNAVIGGMTGIHQFCRVGQFALTGGQSMITQDIAPFTIAVGNRAKTTGINFIGLERAGFTSTEIEEINEAFRIFFKKNLIKSKAVSMIAKEFPDSVHLKTFVEFIESSSRGVCR
jgi:UDP-N-acetylglucosamine acyltransferase